MCSGPTRPVGKTPVGPYSAVTDQACTSQGAPQPAAGGGAVLVVADARMADGVGEGGVEPGDEVAQVVVDLSLGAGSGGFDPVEGSEFPEGKQRRGGCEVLQDRDGLSPMLVDDPGNGGRGSLRALRGGFELAPRQEDHAEFLIAGDASASQVEYLPDPHSRQIGDDQVAGGSDVTNQRTQFGCLDRLMPPRFALDLGETGDA